MKNNNFAIPLALLGVLLVVPLALQPVHADCIFPGGSIGQCDPGVASNYTSSSGGCSGDCTPPTIGLNSNGIRLVGQPIIYHNSQDDFVRLAEYYHTPMENFSATTGDLNRLSFVVYENSGIDALWRVGISVGVPKDGAYSDGVAKVEWMRSAFGQANNNQPIITKTDPQNILDVISFKVVPEKCFPEDTDLHCNRVNFVHKWNEAPRNTMMILDLTDQNRNTIQHRLNHGIDVLGNSLNPADTHKVIDNYGRVFTITETSWTTAVDSTGREWTMNSPGLWTYITQVPQKTVVENAHGISKESSTWKAYQDKQVEIAKQKFDANKLQKKSKGFTPVDTKTKMNLSIAKMASIRSSGN